ncbi:SRPBCC family protein [Dactylosporangium sp. NPDC050688]|uniref:SRPBCC family protein n=1 Tax=Dactylosporangium sp. NPDC050688 TaxID=3157217 RepID=UPI00340F23CC
MSTLPTGRWIPTATGGDLVIIRTFQAPAEDVWASVTEPERTARWFGPWKGDGRPGGTIEFQMVQEEGAPWFDAVIEACEPPHRLALTSSTAHLELVLTPVAAGTELCLVHHLSGPEGVADFGPGWEFYLDALVASRDGIPMPRFEDYDPSMRPYFTALTTQPG